MGMIHMASLGCAKNYADSEVFLGMLVEQTGLVPTAEPEQAKVIVVNTCAFINEAVQETVDTVLELGQHKVASGGNCQLLYVIGCLPGRYDGKTLQSLLPEVDRFLAPSETGELVGMIVAELGRAGALGGDGHGVVGTGHGVDVDGERGQEQGDASVFLYDYTMTRLLTRSHTVFIKVADGCDRGCTFCTIPSIKGKQRSRGVEDIAAEMTRLARSGVREFNLVAQDLTAYGSDLPAGSGVNLTSLLTRLVQIPEVAWIRLLYLYPRPFPAGLVDVMASNPKICPYVDMPVQHVSERVVKAMGRGHTGRDSVERIAELRARIPDIAVRTSLLVGFPGETEEDFAQLEAVVRNGTFDNVGVFVFSPEDGTPAATMDGQVPRSVAVRRKNKLLRIQQRVSEKRNQKLVGTTQRVLVEGPHPESDLLIQGRIAQQAPEVDGVVLINDLGEGGTMPVAGDMVMVEITEAHPYDLVGRIVG